MKGLSFRTDKPFAITPDPRFAFESSSYQKAYLALVSGIEQRAGLMTLVGPAGCGKTVLLQSIKDGLASKRKFAFFSSLPDQTLDDLLGLLFAELRLPPISSSHEERVDALFCHLRKRKAPAVLLVDDAHCLPDSTLAGLVGLIAFRRGERESFQMILSGRRQLERRLKHRELAWISDFVSVTARLDPLAPDELSEYVAHRLEIARHSLLSGRRTRNPIEPPALEQVFRYSQGVPRTVNRLCQCALSRNSGRVNAARIDEAAFECGLAPAPETWRSAAAQAYTAQSEWSSAARGLDLRKARKPSREWLRVGYRAAPLVIAAGFGATFAYQASWSRGVGSLSVAFERAGSLEDRAPVAQVGSAPVTMTVASVDPTLAEERSPSETASLPETEAEPAVASAPNGSNASRNEIDASALSIEYQIAPPDTMFDAEHGFLPLEPDDARDRAQTADADDDIADVQAAETVATQIPEADDTIPEARPQIADIPISLPASPQIFTPETSQSADGSSDQHARSTGTVPSRPIDTSPAQAMEAQAVSPDMAAFQPADARSGPSEPFASASSPSRRPMLDPEWLTARGHALLQDRDPAGARLFFERAAEQGHAGAMGAVGWSFDPLELQRLGVVGVSGDPHRALEWYRRAAEAGDQASAERIGMLMDWMARRQGQLPMSR